ncbi:4Fe-4S ferredoxin [Candidatus Woesearchaeota archaeon CG11_big_fil_rev_8_21_14_0_20_43_8]|nr:MAG: 4Fe-4S ferredoxin [Candidatus Woesearchaeota archaeon CG11_big_fil_rev_8_21_14_0_20_43_8]
MKIIVDKKGLLKFIDSIRKKYRLIAPVQKDEGLFFDAVSNTSKIVFDYINPKNTAKEFFFPIKDPILRYDSDSIEEVKKSKENIAIFGIRPCDARALSVMDKVFNWDTKDGLYDNRRKNALLIGFGCNKAGDHCFCTSFGYGPHESKDVDVMVYQLGKDEFMVLGVSKRGVGCVVSGKKASPVHESRRKELEKGIVFKKKMDVDKVYKKLDTVFDSDYWTGASFHCIGCGTCTFLCPSCHCFCMSDERNIRYRIWDSCQFACFTKHTSGHNPRPTQRERYRQRVYHKFSYYKKNFGEHLCVGCGRCTLHCPMKVDIFSIANGTLDINEK